MNKGRLAESRDDKLSTVGKELTLFASASLNFGDLEHPNKMPFEGILTYLGVPSDKAPGGASGKKVLIPKEVGLKAMASLEGMAVNYVAGSMDGHDPTQKIGVITKAYTLDPLDNGAVPLYCEGYIYANDFPEVAQNIKAYQSELGFSYETAKTRLMAGIYEEEEVAVVLDIGYFTGAAILWKSSAAYQTSQLVASAEEEKEGNELDLEKLLAELKDAFKAEVQVLRDEFKPKEVAPVVEAPKVDEPKVEAPVVEAPKAEEPKVEAPVVEAPKAEAPPAVEAQPEAQIQASADVLAELKAMREEIASLKQEATIQASARKSIAYPTTLMAKYDVKEENEITSVMASIDARTDLSIEERFALKLEARQKADK